MIEYGRNVLKEGARIFDPVIVGFPSREHSGEIEFIGATIGREAVIRSGTVIYCDVTIGDNFQCGHNVLIRERTVIGNRTTVGTSTVIEGNCTIGNNVRIQSMVFISTHTVIGNGVFIGPAAVLLNDRYPPTGKPELKGPVIKDNAVVGGNATILPGVTIGEGSAVAAGSILTKDVPPYMLAIGAPARFRPLPREMMR